MKDKEFEEDIDDVFEMYWKEFEDWVDSYDQSDYPTSYTPKNIARHFYELGKKNILKECFKGCL